MPAQMTSVAEALDNLDQGNTVELTGTLIAANDHSGIYATGTIQDASGKVDVVLRKNVYAACLQHFFRGADVRVCGTPESFSAGPAIEVSSLLPAKASA